MNPNALGLDSQLFLLINNGLASSFLDPIMIIATLLGEPHYLALFLLPALWMMDRPHFTRNLILMVAVMSVAIMATEGAKYLINTPRPLKAMKSLIDSGAVHIHTLFEPKYKRGFPSGHTVRIFSVAVLFFFFYRKTGWLLIGLGTLTALSRIYVGAHYPSDVLGGAVIGSGVAVIVYRINVWKFEAEPMKSEGSSTIQMSSPPDLIDNRVDQQLHDK